MLVSYHSSIYVNINIRGNAMSVANLKGSLWINEKKEEKTYKRIIKPENNITNLESDPHTYIFSSKSF